MTSSPPPQPRRSPAWINGLALLSLVLSGLLWLNGLVDSLQRPSVGNVLELRQKELAALAAPALPPPWRSALAGARPLQELRQALQQELERAPEPPSPQAQLQLALLELQDGAAGEGRQRLEQLSPQVPPQQRALVRRLLTAPASGGGSAGPGLAEALEPWSLPPITLELTCEALGGSRASCTDRSAQRGAVLRLLGTGVAPVLLLGLGTLLLLRQLWLRWRGKLPAPAPLQGPPLSLAEATLLIAGGFVVLGELLMPLLLAPLLQSVLAPLVAQPALQQGLLVLGLYLGLMAVPLLMLWSQLRPHGIPPAGGWLQWRWQPLAGALRRALAQVLMVLPLVALVGWLLERLVGDPGGSNPLLELVLTSANPLALACFAITALVLAPLFEETLFRGVLLPVLAQRWGNLAAVVISALVFGIAHLSFGELPPLFVLGLGLGWLRIQSGRLGASVLMHGLWNSLTFANLLLLAG